MSEPHPIYPCPLCGKEYDSPSALKTHYHVHTKSGCTCLVCGQTFKSQHWLCLHAFQVAMRHHDERHAVMYYLVRPAGHSTNPILTWGSKLAEKLLKKGEDGLGHWEDVGYEVIRNSSGPTTIRIKQCPRCGEEGVLLLGRSRFTGRLYRIKHKRDGYNETCNVPPSHPANGQIDEIYRKVRGGSSMNTWEELQPAIQVMRGVVEQREETYDHTWREVPLCDLISVARLKTYRMHAALRKGDMMKVRDEAVDLMAYAAFVLEIAQEIVGAHEKEECEDEV